MKNIVMLWQSIPICGLITLKSLNENPNFKIISTLDSPLNEDEISLFGSQLQIIEDFSEINIEELISKFDYFILPGWSNKHVLKMAKMAKINNKITIMSSDNSKKNNIRQWIGAAYFQLILKKYFDLAFVPGKSGSALMKSFGFNNDTIIEGLYGAFEKIFYLDTDIKERNNEFLFVGQLIKRKSIDIIINSFLIYLRLGGSWDLRIVGDGPMKKKLPFHPKIHYDGYDDSRNIARMMNKSKFLIMISREEHWGTVTCEAAACGLPLIIYDKVGSFKDIFYDNGLLTTNLSTNSISSLFLSAENTQKSDYWSMVKSATRISQNYNSDNFFNSIKTIINKDIQRSQ